MRTRLKVRVGTWTPCAWPTWSHPSFLFVCFTVNYTKIPDKYHACTPSLGTQSFCRVSDSSLSLAPTYGSVIYISPELNLYILNIIFQVHMIQTQTLAYGGLGSCSVFGDPSSLSLPRLEKGSTKLRHSKISFIIDNIVKGIILMTCFFRQSIVHV